MCQPPCNRRSMPVEIPVREGRRGEAHSAELTGSGTLSRRSWQGLHARDIPNCNFGDLRNIPISILPLITAHREWRHQPSSSTGPMTLLASLIRRQTAMKVMLTLTRMSRTRQRGQIGVRWEDFQLWGRVPGKSGFSDMFPAINHLIQASTVLLYVVYRSLLLLVNSVPVIS